MASTISNCLSFPLSVPTLAKVRPVCSFRQLRAQDLLLLQTMFVYRQSLAIFDDTVISFQVYFLCRHAKSIRFLASFAFCSVTC